MAILFFPAGVIYTVFSIVLYLDLYGFVLSWFFSDVYCRYYPNDLIGRGDLPGPVPYLDAGGGNDDPLLSGDSLFPTPPSQVVLVVVSMAVTMS